MGMFSGASEVKLSKYEKLYFEPNTYIIEIVECKLVDDNMIISGEVLAKKNDNGEKPELGDTAAYFITQRKGAKQKQIWLSNLMAFMCSVYQCETDEYDDDDWENMICKAFEKNNLKGETLMLKTYHIDTEAGGTYTKHVWLGEPTEKDWNKFELTID